MVFAGASALLGDAQAVVKVNLQFPEKLAGFMQPRRLKVAYGGRGGAKSRTVAGMLVALGALRPLRILCARETQKSISDSVHRLLCDQIQAYSLTNHYRITQTSIVGVDPKTGRETGTEFMFHGIRHNISNLKSVEAVDIAWVEEGQSVSKESWETLIPTIRKDNANIFGTPSEAEIWVTFNPLLEEDDTYQRFIIQTPPGALIVKINYNDNPWFPEVLRKEMEHMKATDYDAYLNVWEGNCRRALEGAIYGKELRDAETEGRICRVPYDPSKPVHTFWDLGWSDQTAIWFAQAIGFEFRLIDYLEDHHRPLNHYLKAIQDRPYIYGQHWMPHDARAKQLGTGRSIEEIAKFAGLDVRVVPKLSIADGINACRTVFPKCFFDQEKTKIGLQRLRYYRYADASGNGVQPQNPLHDANSNGADGFRSFAVAIQEPARERAKMAATAPMRPLGSSAWMG